MLPKDPVILLSFVNTKLRDYHDSLDDFCKNHNCAVTDITDKLATLNYHYDKGINQFR
ncbi:DUF4250 domain-containing protein [Vallitaleaceae bacterium 9-2]